MKVEAYRCDVCKKIHAADDIQGLQATESLFDKEHLSYPLEKDPSKTEFHFCMDCYRDKVLTPAQNYSDRRNNEDGYKTLLRTFTYSFKANLILMASRERRLRKGR